MVDISEIRSTLLYFIREKLYNSMVATCKLAIEVDSRDVSLLFYRSICHLLNGQYEEGIRELEVIKSETDIKLACTVGLTYCYKYSESNDKRTREALDAQLKETKSSTNFTDYYNTAFLFFALRKFDKALELIEKLLNDRISDADAWSLKGWILMLMRTPMKDDYTLISQAFDTAMNYNSKHLDSAVGKSETQLRLRAYEDAINTSNRTIVRFPTLSIPLIQKIRILFCMQEWEQVAEVMNRLSNMHPKNLSAMKMNILMLLCKAADYSEAAKCIKAFTAELERTESTTAFLFYENSVLFSRLAATNNSVLDETFIMCEKAAKLTPNVTNYIIELGYQSLLQGRVKDAVRYYKAANKIDSTSFDSLLGMTLCELTENGKSENVKQQIFFLLELQELEAPPPLLLLMQARITETPEQALLLLEAAMTRQLKLVDNLFYSEDYLLKLDVNLMMNIVMEYMKYAYVIPPNSGKTSPRHTKYSIVSSVTKCLEIITKACPGLFEAQLLLAKMLHLNEDNNAALVTLNHIITNIDATSSDALLLMANIQVSVQQFERAAQSLEVGLSHNFKVRENPMYHYIMGIVEKNRGNLTEATKCHTTAFNLMQAQPQSKEITLSDKAAIYKELILVHTESSQPHEAAKYMEEAMREFRNTPEESKLLILSAEQALNQDSTQAAIEILNQIKTTDLYYSDAKQKLADILLYKCKDRKAYLRQYQDMVNNIPDSKSYLKLADAYLKILEPSLAVDAYRTALELNPNDPSLISKFGRALVLTHYYADAIEYYLGAIQKTNDTDLKIRLAELYIHLRRTSEAEALLTKELEGEKQKKTEDVTALQFRTRLYLLLTRCQEKSNNVRGAIGSLKFARDNQSRVRKLIAITQKSVPEHENNIAVEISTRLAELTADVKENQQAINHYKEALIIHPNNCKVLGALAKMYMQVNFMELCQQTCTTLLSLDPDNEEGSVLMADIAFRKMDFDMAVFHFTQLVTKQPSNWPALVRLVEVMRRTGSLDEIPLYLEQGQRFSENPAKEPGLAFATALYQWYSGNLNAALRNFNIARQDRVWGQQAIYSMIEICLNPEDELLGDQANDLDDYEYRDSRSMALKTAERLLRELKQSTNTFNTDDMLRCRILGNFLALATKDKPQIESALEDFVVIASKETYKEHLGPILGMAMAHTLLKQSQRAKTQLKRVAKNSWNFEEADYLERCWLLLADYYANSNKYELSSELLRKVLQYNKSCCKAYEYSGFIAEKEQKYKDAANFYDSAWKYNGRNNPVLGFKLGYCLMKCKKYAEAIDISQQILKINPDYPRVKKDILDKCINNLRT